MISGGHVGSPQFLEEVVEKTVRLFIVVHGRRMGANRHKLK